MCIVAYRGLSPAGYFAWFVWFHGDHHSKLRSASRGSIPMYIKAIYALLQLPDNEGNLTQISDLVAQHAEFAKDLDWTPRPGAKTYPRYQHVFND